MTVDRKFLPAWTGQLQLRFLILTNELPKISDTSGALASRFIVLSLSQSFYGKEDHDLTDRLRGELPSIFNWALEGWRRLSTRKRFLQPASASDAVRALEELGSPMAAFVSDCCELGAAHEVECSALFSRWRAWCEQQGREHAGNAQSFGRDLRAVCTEVKDARRWVDGEARRYYTGIRVGDAGFVAVIRDKQDRTGRHEEEENRGRDVDRTYDPVIRGSPRHSGNDWGEA